MEKMKLNIQLFGLTTTLTASATSSTDETAITTNQNYINLSIRVQTTKPTWNGQKGAYYQVTTTSQNNGTQTGSKYYFSIGSSTGSGDKTFNVALGPFDHNPDGTLNDVSISVYVRITDSTHTTKTASVAMGTIPRASEITSVSSGTTVYNPTIVWTPLSSSFKYKVKYTGILDSQSSISGLISPNTTSSYSYNGLSVYNYAFVNANSSTITATATLYTYKSDGTTLIGQKTKTFSITLNSEVKPTISFSNLAEADTTMQNANWGIYVQNHSKLSFKVTTGSSLLAADSVATTITTNGQTFNQNGYTNNTFTTTNVLSSSGTNTISATARDNRGRSTTASTTYNVVAYSNPTIATAQVQRCNANGNIDNNGEYMYISYGASISSCSNKNTPSAVYKVGYRVHNTGSYTYVNLTTNANSYSASGVLFTDGIKAASSSGTKVQFSTNNTYDIQFYVKDYFTEYTNVQLLDSGFDLMNFNANGKAMAIGKVSEASSNQSLFEVNMDTNISGALTTGNNISATKSNGEVKVQATNSGNSIYLYAKPTERGIWDTGFGQVVQNYGDGNVFKGSIYTYDTGHVGTATGNGKLVIKKATSSEAPNNGVVLEYGNSTNWTGQLFIGDNATQGIYYNGWSSSTRGIWRRLADEPIPLYTNTSGTQSNFSLSDAYTNYKTIEVFFRNSWLCSSTKMDVSAGQSSMPLTITYGVGTNGISYHTACIQFSGSNVTFMSDRWRDGNLTPTTQNVTTDQRIWVTKVVGYYR